MLKTIGDIIDHVKSCHNICDEDYICDEELIAEFNKCQAILGGIVSTLCKDYFNNCSEKVITTSISECDLPENIFGNNITGIFLDGVELCKVSRPAKFECVKDGDSPIFYIAKGKILFKPSIGSGTLRIYYNAQPPSIDVSDPNWRDTCIELPELMKNYLCACLSKKIREKDGDPLLELSIQELARLEELIIRTLDTNTKDKEAVDAHESAEPKPDLEEWACFHDFYCC